MKLIVKSKPLKMNKFLSFLLTMFLLSGCTDPCQDLVCLNGGTCISGTCLCPDFYEGTDCGIEERTKYFGSYTGTTTYSDAQGNTSTYADSKVVSSSNNGISYINFAGGIYGSLTAPGSGVFDIPSQSSANPGAADSYFSGSGNFSGTYVTYTLTVENNGETITMSFTGTK